MGTTKAAIVTPPGNVVDYELDEAVIAIVGCHVVDLLAAVSKSELRVSVG
ncbi:hypothetical protein [Marisediminicola antarctica]|nr:hypothetical protein [Marisediminicola antarctica]